MSVATVILEQLGGRQFAMMTGAKQFAETADQRGLRFRIGRNSKGVNVVVVVLEGSDLYTVKFLRVTSAGAVLKASASDVYCDKLQAVFTEHTGMYTKF